MKKSEAIQGGTHSPRLILAPSAGGSAEPLGQQDVHKNRGMNTDPVGHLQNVNFPAQQFPPALQRGL